MPNPQDWNEMVPAGNRLASPNFNARKPAGLKPTHIVIHVTGTDSLASVRQTFMAPNSVSAHYLVGKDGALVQFVPDASRAWHAGIDSNCRNLYRKGKGVWCRYLKYFSWYKGYPKDAQFVNGDLKPVWDKTEAVFVTHADGTAWPEYDYFFQRWPELNTPLNFDVDPDPNNYAIGIETLGVGAKSADSQVYTPAMYGALRGLIANLSKKYAIPMQKGRVIGHEDVNPIGRFGWDPSGGFDWAKVYT